MYTAILTDRAGLSKYVKMHEIMSVIHVVPDEVTVDKLIKDNGFYIGGEITRVFALYRYISETVMEYREI